MCVGATLWKCLNSNKGKGEVQYDERERARSPPLGSGLMKQGRGGR